MEKIEFYQNHKITVLLNFNATEHSVRDRIDREKILTTVTYDYSLKISINEIPVLNNIGQTFYDEYTQNIEIETYKEMIVNGGITIGKSIIDGN